MSQNQRSHELIQQIKELALNLNRPPTRTEFLQAGGSRHALDMCFGTFSALLIAAGLQSYRDRTACANKAQRIDNSVFERDIDTHLDNYEPRPLPEAISGQYQRTLFIGDLHAPFANLPLLNRIYRFAEKEQPEVVVQIGDLYDFLSHGRFPRSHNTFTPRQEQQAGRLQAETMWAEIKKAAPKAKCYQLWGNHDARPLKRILEVYPEAEDWVEQMITKLMTFDGVETLEDARQELMLPGDVMVHHGYRSRLGQHRDFALLNAVIGHTHVGGVVYRQIRGRVLWELNCGLAGDQNAKGLTYTSQKIVNWTPGFGWLDSYGPRFIPG